MRAFVILPSYTPAGGHLVAVHMVFARELAEHFGEVTQEDIAGGWRDLDTGRDYTDSAVRFTVCADWTAKGGRMARRLENIAARYAEACEQEAVTVTHADGSTVYAGPMSADPVRYDDAPAAPLASRRDREGWRALREDRAARFDRLTADAA